MVDVNSRALQLSKENANLNSLDNVLIKESDCLSSVMEQKFAVIMTNPPIRAGKKVYIQFMSRATNAFYQTENYGLSFKRNKVLLLRWISYQVCLEK